MSLKAKLHVSRILCVVVVSFLLTACKDSAAPPLTISTPEPTLSESGNIYYQASINGPAYQVVALTNSSNFEADFTQISAPSNSSGISLVARTSSVGQTDTAYGTYAECGVSASTALSSTLGAGQTCLLIYHAATQDPTQAPQQTTVSVNYTINGVNYLSQVNLTNTTYLYLGGHRLSSVGGAAPTLANGHTLVAQCSNQNGSFACTSAFSPDQTPNGEINDLTTDPAGNLYAVGGFTTIGGANATNPFVAKCLNGQCSNVLNAVANNEIFALDIDQNFNAYLGGLFNQFGSISSVGSGTGGASNLLIAECNLFSGTCSNYLAGSNPDYAVSPPNGPIAAVRGLSENNGTLYVAGNLSQVGAFTNANNPYIYSPYGTPQYTQTQSMIASCTGNNCSNYFSINNAYPNNIILDTMVTNINNNNVSKL